MEFENYKDMSVFCKLAFGSSVKWQLPKCHMKERLHSKSI